MGNIDPLELAWTLISGIGLVFSVLNMYEAHRDLDASLELMNGVTKAAVLTAKLSFRSELIRMLQLVCLFTVGVIALLQPAAQPTPDEPGRAGFRLGVLFLFFGFSILITLNTTLMFIGRRKILTILGVRRNGNGGGGEDER